MVQPRLSTVKYEHRNDQRELEIQSFHTFFIREEEAQEEEKESFLSTRRNSGQVNSHPV